MRGFHCDYTHGPLTAISASAAELS